MAIIKIANDFLNDNELFEVVMNNFDTIVQIGNDGNTSVFRVQNDEIPKDDVQISAILYHIDGVRPFIIGWD